MEEGISNKKTVFVGNLDEVVNETHLLETFSTFGQLGDAVQPILTINQEISSTFSSLRQQPTQTLLMVGGQAHRLFT